MQAHSLPKFSKPAASSFTHGTGAIEGLLVLDEFERPFVASVSGRDPYDWSLDRPGTALHIGASSPVIPPDLDPHLAPAHQPVLIVLGGGAEPVGAYVRSLMIAWCATVFLAAMGLLAFTAAVNRLPAIHQASIDAEGV